MILSCQNISKAFVENQVLKNVSFHIEDHEKAAIVGINGAGKTTAMRMLCGLSYPTSGSGSVAGFDIMSQAEQIKRHIGYMSQKFSLYEDLTVKENLTQYSTIYGMSD